MRNKHSIWFLSLMFLFVTASLVGCNNLTPKPKIEGWTTEGLYLTPLESYKYVKQESLALENALYVPVLLVGDQPEKYRFLYLYTVEGQTLPVTSASFSLKVDYGDNVKLYLAKLLFTLPKEGKYDIKELSYTDNGEEKKTKVNFVYEIALRDQSPELAPRTLETDEFQNIYDVEFSNATKETQKIMQVLLENPSLAITELKQVKNGKETDVLNQAISVAPGEIVRLKLRFSKTDPNAASEISPKFVYQDSKGKTGEASLFGIMYPGVAKRADMQKLFQTP